MDPLRSRSVFRYFLPADSFVRILVHDARENALPARPGLNRCAYRRLVIESCCPEYGKELVERLVEQCPDDPLAAEDLLYQLCVEVNPHFDIHTVRLAERADESEPRGESEHARDPHGALERLRKRSRSLEKRLLRRVIGQDEAVAGVARAVRRAAAGLAPEGRPLGTFLLVGRTGTGKTELARALASELFPTARGSALVRIDCSEFALSHEYAKLIGAPPGYVGHEQGGILTDAVRKDPHCVVLFDEIEKAHPRLHHLLLQVLDEGRLTDGRGRNADFSQALIVLTSNVGAFDVREADRRVGFGACEPLARGSVEEITARALDREFAPEFLARLDERFVFRDLTVEDARGIAARMLEELAVRVRRRRARVAFSESVAAWVAKRGFSPATGARELRRVVQREIEVPLAELLLAEGPQRGLLRVSIRRDAPAFARAA